MIIDAKGCWDSAVLQHNDFFDSTVNAGLTKNKRKLPVSIFRFITTKHDSIRDGQENEFRAIQAEYKKIWDRLSDAAKLRTQKILKNIYNYESFSKKHPSKWCAYKLCESLSVLTCPYCNLSYGHTLKVGLNGVVRPTLDHFFDKATYPLYALSLGNLIASCYACNSSLKGQKNFFTIPHLNPLVSGEQIKISLDADLVAARHDLRILDSANIKLDYEVTNVRAMNSIKTFYLKERYQLLANEARFIAKNMQIYSTFAEQDSARLEWLKRGVTNENYRNRVLGKMIKDFSDIYL